MKNGRKIKLTAVLSAVVMASAMTVYAAYDSSTDPLVSLSYLNDVFTPQIKSDVKSELTESIRSDVSESLYPKIQSTVNEMREQLKDELKKELNSELYKKISEDLSMSLDAMQSQVDALKNEYAVVELQPGGRLIADSSCEIVLLNGSVSVRCSSQTEGLIDCTDGVILYDGQKIPLNHKILSPENGDGRGVAAFESAKLLVRGGYTLG